MSPKLTVLKVLISIPVLAVLAGCGKSEPEYVVVKNVEQPPAAEEDHSGHNHAMPDAMAAHPAPAPEGLGFTFAAPEGWTQQPPSRMKLLSFAAGSPPERVAECAVSAFPGDVGGQLANINRWRRQVGLGPTTEEVAQSFVKELTISGMEAWQVDFTGPEGTDLRVIVSVVSHNGQSWFFKLSGNAASVEGELDAYATFLDSVKF